MKMAREEEATRALKMALEDAADIIIEAVEVLLNHILYVRGVYPAQIFKKRRIYNTPVYVSIYPPLNEYIGNLLRPARELLRRQELHRLEIIIYKNECDHIETYICDLKNQASGEIDVNDQYLLKYEEQLRAALYKLCERVKLLPKLSSDAKFKVQLHTTQTAFVQLSHNSQYQEFPWLQTSAVYNGQQTEPQKFGLLPLIKVNQLGLQMDAHIFI